MLHLRSVVGKPARTKTRILTHTHNTSTRQLSTSRLVCCPVYTHLYNHAKNTLVALTRLGNCGKRTDMSKIAQGFLVHSHRLLPTMVVKNTSVFTFLSQGFEEKIRLLHIYDSSSIMMTFLRATTSRRNAHVVLPS